MELYDLYQRIQDQFIDELEGILFDTVKEVYDKPDADIDNLYLVVRTSEYKYELKSVSINGWENTYYFIVNDEYSISCDDQEILDILSRDEYILLLTKIIEKIKK